MECTSNHELVANIKYAHVTQMPCTSTAADDDRTDGRWDVHEASLPLNRHFISSGCMNLIASLFFIIHAKGFQVMVFVTFDIRINVPNVYDMQYRHITIL